MELILAVLNGLGIFLSIPVLIGLTIYDIYLLNNRHAEKIKKEKAEVK